MDASRAPSQRVRIPSTKSQESKANQELYETTINGGPKAPKKAARATTANATPEKSKTAGPNGDDATGWQAVMEVIGYLREIVTQQQDTIIVLSGQIKETQAELRQVVSVIQDFKTQAAEE